MKIFKTNSELEKKVQRVESLMRELNLKIRYSYGLQIVDKEKSYRIIDVDSQDTCTEFPRTFDSEKIRFE